MKDLINEEQRQLSPHVFSLEVAESVVAFIPNQSKVLISPTPRLPDKTHDHTINQKQKHTSHLRRSSKLHKMRVASRKKSLNSQLKPVLQYRSQHDGEHQVLPSTHTL